MPLSPPSNHSHLSPKSKALSTSPNFNPFSPLSPYQVNRELEEDHPDGGSSMSRGRNDRDHRIYSRQKLLNVAKRAPITGWPRPEGMAPLAEWFGDIGGKPPIPDDPAIVSIGHPPGRKLGGYGEGFGFGGGIGGKGLSRGGRQTGPNHTDARVRRNELDANGLPLPHREMFGGQMGKFSVKNSGERLRPSGHEDARKPREDNRDWRRGVGPTQSQGHRQDRRPWTNHHEDEHSQPAWMADPPGPDPAILSSSETAPFTFTAGQDPIAAHKRMMKESAGGSREPADRPALVSFFGGSQDPAASSKTAKTPKHFNASDYLLPSKSQNATTPEENIHAKEGVSASRFQRFFGTPPAGTPDPYRSPPPFGPEHALARTTMPDHREPMASTAAPTYPDASAFEKHSSMPSSSTTSPLPISQQPQDHASRLMGLLTSKSPQPAPTESETSFHRPSSQTSSHPQTFLQNPATLASPPPGRMLGAFDHRIPGMSMHAAQFPPPQPHFPPNIASAFPGPNADYRPSPGPIPMMAQAPGLPLQSLPQHTHGHHQQFADRDYYRQGPAPYPQDLQPQTMPSDQLSPHQLPSRQQNMLATLYGQHSYGAPK